jgi:hypothetical protein
LATRGLVPLETLSLRANFFRAEALSFLLRVFEYPQNNGNWYQSKIKDFAHDPFSLVRRPASFWLLNLYARKAVCLLPSNQ